MSAMLRSGHSSQALSEVESPAPSPLISPGVPIHSLPVLSGSITTKRPPSLLPPLASSMPPPHLPRSRDQSWNTKVNPPWSIGITPSASLAPPVTLHPAFNTWSRQRRTREHSANSNDGHNSGKERDLVTVRSILEGMDISSRPTPSPSPTKMAFGWLSPAPPMSMDGSSGEGLASGYLSPMRVHASPARSNFGGQASPRSGNTSPTKTQFESAAANQYGHDALNAAPPGNIWKRIHDAVTNVEKLEGPNYPSWRYWFHRKVTSAGKVWGHINGSCPRPERNPNLKPEEVDPEVERWDMDEAAIYCALLSSLESAIVHPQVQACTTAKEVWDRLSLLYTECPTPETRAADLMRELSQAVYYEGEDLKAHLWRLKRIVQELQSSPYPIPDPLAVWFIYDSMPSSFASHVAALRKETQMSVAAVCMALHAIGQQLLGSQCFGKQGRSLYEAHQRSAALPFDLRHYKYRGNGLRGDGALYARARRTCGACLATGHAPFTAECPQTDVRLGLWGLRVDPVWADQLGQPAAASPNGMMPGGRTTPSGRFTPNGQLPPGGQPNNGGQVSFGAISSGPSGTGNGIGGNALGIVSSRPSGAQLDNWR